MYTNNSLGDRMKQYEDSYRICVPNRLPLLLRIDGKSFHSWTLGCEKPFDQKLINALNEVGIYLCQNISGAQICYQQSDELNILIHNYKKLNTEPWFNNNIQKIVSVAAGMASAKMTELSSTIFGYAKLAVFDARVFILPESEVNNLFEFRQQDATRNSIQMVSRSLYSHKECNNKNCSQLQEMIFQKGINWNDLPTYQKRGRCIIKVKETKPFLNKKTNKEELIERSSWSVDNNIPIFHKDPNYINRLLVTDDSSEK